LFSSLTIHPNKLLVATGQTAGHDGREGKVRLWRICPENERTKILFLQNVFFFISLAPYPSVEFGQLGDGGRVGIGRIRTVNQLSVVFQSGKSTCSGFTSARNIILADDIRFTNSIISYLLFCFSNSHFGFDRTAAVFCAPSTREMITTYLCGTGRRTKRVTRSRRPRSVESLITIIVIR